MLKKLLLLAALATPACAPDPLVVVDDCVEACEDRPSCNGVRLDCDAQCELEVDRGCDAAYVAVLDCEAGRADTCDHDGGSPACAPERDAYVACLEPTLTLPR